MAGEWQNIAVAVTGDISDLQAKLNQAGQATTKFGATTSKTAGKTGSVWSRAMGSMSAQTVALGAAVGISATKIASSMVNAGRAVWDTGVKIQKSTATLTGLYEDAGLAAQTIEDLKRAAAASTLDFSGFTSLAETLAYAGTQGPRAVAVIENIAVAIEGAGGSTEALDSVGEALVKIVNNGKTTRRELLQISNATFPIFDSLSTYMGVTIEELNRLVTDGQVGINEVLGAMEAGSGRFFEMQKAGAEEVRQTWSGTWARWKDNAQVALGSVVADLLPRLMTLMQSAVGVARDFASRLSGAWDALVSSGRNLVSIVQDLWGAMEPGVTLMAQVFGGAVIVALSAFAAALSGITGLLADNAWAVELLGVALTTWLAISTFNRIASAATSLFETIALRAMYARDGVGKLGGAIGGLARVAGPAAVVAGFALTLKSFDEAARKAKARIDALEEGVQTDGLAGLERAYNEAAAGSERLSGAMHDGQSIMGRFGRGFQALGQAITPFADTVAEDTENLKANRKAKAEWGAQIERVQSIASRLGGTYGLTTDQVIGLLEADKDLNLATATTAEMMESVAGSVDRFASSTGMSTEQVGMLAGGLEDAGVNLDEFFDGMEKAAGAASEAVTSFGDLSKVTDFKAPEVKTPKVSDIVGWYDRVIGSTQQFSSDIAALMEQGYDPALITRFMTAGVEQAGPTVHALTEGYSEGLVEFVNGAEAIMAAFADRQAELARIMYVATTAPTAELTANVSTAAAMVQASWDENFDPEAAAGKLGLSPDDWNQIVSDFGLGVATIETTADDSNVEVEVKASMQEVQTALDGVQGRLGSLAEGDRYTLTGADLLDLSSIVGSVSAADGILARLEEDRQTLVDIDAPQWKLDQVDADIDAVARVRDAILWAEGRNGAVTAAELDEIATRPRTAWIHVQADTSGFSASMDWAVGRIRDLQWRARLASMGTLPPALAGAYGQGRYGGFHAFQSGGVRPLTVGGVTKTPMVAWGEPQTGGEAFIPRLGISDTRAKKILDVAAGWHGMQVVPAGQLRGLGGSVTVDLGGINVTAGAGADGPGIASEVRTVLRGELPRIVDAVAEARGRSKAVTGR